jgi:hypothetical protein
MSEKIYRAKVPLYGTYLMLVVSDDVRAYHRQHCDRDDNVIAFTAWIKGRLSIIIPPDAKIGTIAHEVVHAAAEALDHHGAKWGVKNQEPLCYLITWIMDWIYRVWTEKKFEKNCCAKYRSVIERGHEQ